MTKRMRVVVSVTCAVLAVIVCALYAQHVEAEAQRERTQTLQRYGGDVVSLVVANRSIEPGETIAASDVEARDWISSLAPEGALLSVDDVVGKEVSVPVAANAPLVELNFRNLSLIEDIPAGHVAVSIPITEKLGISAAVAVGSRVVAYRATEGSAEPLGSSAIVLAAPTAGSSLSHGTITIAVPSGDVSAVLASSSTGDLRLVVPADDVKELPKKQERTSEVEPKGDAAAKKSDGAEAHARS